MKYFTACLLLVCAVQVLAQSDGDVILVDGGSSSRGLAKVYYQGEWGTICANGIDNRVYQVICRSAGFSNSRLTRLFIGVKTWDVVVLNATRGRILLDQVRCTGNESNIMQCSHSAVGEHHCRHVHDVGVDCYGRNIGSSVELRYGSATDGVLVLSRPNGFGTVCVDDFRGLTNSIVACRMLGVNMSSVTPLQVSRSYYEENIDLPHALPPRVKCHGDETNLTQCWREGEIGLWSPFTRSGLCNEVAIDCLGSANVKVSLVNGNETAGEVQLTYRGESGAVCYLWEYLNKKAAKVFCRMLGYGDREGVVLPPRNTTDHTQVMLDYVSCDGYEQNIVDCAPTWPGLLKAGRCLGLGALDIECRPQPDIAVRLVDGNETSGRLEVHRNGQWGETTVDPLRRAVATVVCRMLNLPSANVVSNDDESFRQLPLIGIVCAGNENHINQCFIETPDPTNPDLNEHYETWITCA